MCVNECFKYFHISKTSKNNVNDKNQNREGLNLLQLTLLVFLRILNAQHIPIVMDIIPFNIHKTCHVVHAWKMKH